MAAPPDLDADKTAAIRSMRRVASAILIGLAGVYGASFTVPDPGYWVLLVRAMAEAGMIGGIADWFAVEALFRHPLRIPIPHTALLPRNQKRAAHNIARFIDAYFLVPDQLLAQIKAIQPAQALARWLSDRHNAARVAGALTAFLDLMLRHQLKAGIDPRAGAAIRAFLQDQLTSKDLSANISILLKDTVQGHLMDDILAEVRSVLDANRDKVTEVVQDRSRWWIASTVDRRIVKVLVDGILSIIDELADQHSDLRGDFDRSVVGLVDRFQDTGRISALINEGRDTYLNAPEAAEAIDKILLKALGKLQENLAENPDHAADVIAGALSDFATQLEQDTGLAEALNTQIQDAAGHVLDHIRPAVTGYITRIIEEWNTDDLVARMENEVGRDLQFIRINGAVLGALVGGVLHIITAGLH